MVANNQWEDKKLAPAGRFVDFDWLARVATTNHGSWNKWKTGKTGKTRLDSMYLYYHL